MDVIKHITVKVIIPYSEFALHNDQNHSSTQPISVHLSSFYLYSSSLSNPIIADQ